MLKYIRDQKDNVFLFSMGVEHKDVAEALKIVPKSAAFLIADGEDVLITGNSTSLSIGPLSDDVAFIKTQMSV